MDPYATAMLVLAAVLVGSILAAVLVVFSWSLRARKKARLEMKRYLQRADVVSRHRLN
jgi:uncharacterized membrane protein YccC